MDSRLMIVEDEETLGQSLQRVLSREGYGVDIAADAETALGKLEEQSYDVIITDIILPGMTGIELLERIKERSPEQVVVVMTAYASLETAVEALRSGAYDYVVKPVMHEEMKQIVKNAVVQRNLVRENTLIRRQAEMDHDMSDLIGDGTHFRSILAGVMPQGRESHLLILGELGTEKELVARGVHLLGSRSSLPFCVYRCRPVPDQAQPCRGLVADLPRGTIFVDEIQNLHADVQALLLRRMEGGDLHLIAASSGDPAEAVRGGLMERDLYERLQSNSVTLPPLRERKDAVGMYAGHFLAKYAREFCRPGLYLDQSALDALAEQPWPGNVRELGNLMERVALLSSGPAIGIDDIRRFLPR